MISSKVGSPVTGEDFFDRENEQRQIGEYLHGDDLLLLAPRRVGKTSLMLRLRDTADARGLEASYVSVASAEDEVGFVRKLLEAASNLDSGPDVVKRLRKGPVGRFFKRVRKVTVSPFGLQLVFRELREVCGDAEPGVATVDRVFEELLSTSKKGYFDYWRQRLEDELGKPDAGLALLLLNAAAVDPDGVTRSSLGQLLSKRIAEPDDRDDRMRYLLDVLENDGYLIEESKRYRFRSPLLREFWLRRVVP